MSDLLSLLTTTLDEKEKKLFHLRSFEENDILFHQHDRCEEVDILIAGDLMMCTYDDDGHEDVFNVIGPNSIFGNNLVFSSNPYYLSHIIALSAGSYLRISKTDLLLLLKSNHAFFLNYMQIIADKTINLTQRLKVISIQNGTKRLLAYLELKGSAQDGYYLKSVTKLAKEISLPRETTSRIISKLVKEGKIIKSHKYLKIKKSVSKDA